jgi:hypothetical protein
MTHPGFSGGIGFLDTSGLAFRPDQLCGKRRCTNRLETTIATILAAVLAIISAILAPVVTTVHPVCNNGGRPDYRRGPCSRRAYDTRSAHSACCEHVRAPLLVPFHF